MKKPFFFLALIFLSSCMGKKDSSVKEVLTTKTETKTKTMIVGNYCEQNYQNHLQRIIEKEGKFYISFFNPLKNKYGEESELLKINPEEYEKYFGSNAPNILNAYKVKNGFFIVTKKGTIYSAPMGKSLLKDGYALVTDISMSLMKIK